MYPGSQQQQYGQPAQPYQAMPAGYGQQPQQQPAAVYGQPQQQQQGVYAQQPQQQGGYAQPQQAFGQPQPYPQQGGIQPVSMVPGQQYQAPSQQQYPQQQAPRQVQPVAMQQSGQGPAGPQYGTFAPSAPGPMGQQAPMQPQQPYGGQGQMVPASGGPVDQYQGPLPAPRDAQLIANRPTAPSLLFQERDNLTYALPLARLDVTMEFHVSTAFVTMSCVFVNSSDKKINGLFALPTEGTVTSSEIRVGENRLLETAVIPSDDMANLKVKNDVAPNDPMASNVPDLFRLPIPSIGKGEHIHVVVNFLQPLDFADGRYHFRLPLQFGAGVLPAGANPAQLIRLQASINCVTPGIVYDSPTHHLQVVDQRDLRVHLGASPKVAPPSGYGSPDFILSYAVPCDTVLGSLLLAPPNPQSYDPRGSFVLFVSPPSKPPGIFGRDIVFLLDRSGSMYGQPYADALNGLQYALQGLREQDRFNVVAFDHEQVQFEQALVPATPDAVERACKWSRSPQVDARGGTDIATPLFFATGFLNQVSGQDPNRLPFVVLLTDGAVADERDIAQRLQKEAAQGSRVRVLTFGIGMYCNWYFLKMLAEVSRGFGLAAAYQEQLLPKVKQLMDMASAPVLTDVRLEMQVQDCELYPFPIPDLYSGAPLSIAGKYKGTFPQTINVVGKLPSGEEFRQQVHAQPNQTIPIEKVFLKQRIDLLVGRQWLTDSADIKQEIVQTSVAESFPSPFTTMVAYETTPQKKADAEKKDPAVKQKSGMSGKTVAALAVGGVVAVGVGIAVFGDIGATMSGAAGLASQAGSGIASLFSNLGGIDCCCDGALSSLTCGGLDSCDGIAEALTCGGCGGCGDLVPCDLDCGSFGDVVSCGFCGDAIDSIGGACGSVFSSCGSCGELFSSCGDTCSGLFSGCGDCVGSLGSVCSDLGGTLGSCCEGAGELLGGLGECLGDICGGLLDFAD